ncbi:MAG: TldD/PmbA family protein [Rhodospirillales bacterium]|nr:TldD/PmbA family protein [Rhodospirillales bacterium]
MTETATADALGLLADLLARAKCAGASAADALFTEGASLSHARRLRQVEQVERAEGQDLGLRVFVGKRQAIVSSSDRSLRAIDELVERAVAMAKAAPEDPFCGLADPAETARTLPDLDLVDPVEPSPEALIERARAAEETALATPGITNSEGAQAGWGTTRVALAASNGFAASYQRSSHSVSVAVIAGAGTTMERDYDYSTAVHGADLQKPEEIGRNAAERALKRLKPRKVETCKAPVIFDPRVAGGLLRHLAGAINGAAIARGTSFLKSKLGKPVFPANVTIIDDPFRRRGLASKPVDGEGIAPTRRAIIDKGVLTTWLLDLRSARQLGMASTGHAARGTSSPPSPSASNLYLEAGKNSRAALLAGVERGLYVSEFIGMGVNNLTGDYSRGAAGFWIENGELTYPISEITVAGNLAEMFMNLSAADDLVFRYGVDAPTLRVDGLTIAGR